MVVKGAGRLGYGETTRIIVVAIEWGELICMYIGKEGHEAAHIGAQLYERERRF